MSEWDAANELASGYCSRFLNPKLAVVLAEEFEVIRAGLGRRALIGPMSVPINHAQIAADAATAYNASDIATVTA